VNGRQVLHVTLRVRRDVPNLRSRRVLAVFEAALATALRREDFRIVHFELLGNHVHLVVEADSGEALARGMNGFSTSVAKRINALFGRHGRVFSDRYHARVLRTPSEVRNALRYVLLNHRSHEARAGVRVGKGSYDPFSSAACFDGWSDAPLEAESPRVTARPRSWLLAVGWRRCGLLSLSEIPALRE
jgi:REP element-mobilizing transposase RayT